MTLSAYLPFFRNHNILSAIPQEPYIWDSVADASRDNIAVRYSLLPYWVSLSGSSRLTHQCLTFRNGRVLPIKYTLFADASRYGTPPIKALFYEFPDEPKLFVVDKQFMIGSALLVTPVLYPNATTVRGLPPVFHSLLTLNATTGHFPGMGSVVWRDFFTHERLSNPTQTQTLEVPLGKIGLHIRSGTAVTLYKDPGYTIASTRRSDLALLVSLSPGTDGNARGKVYLDDGESLPPTPYLEVEVFAEGGRHGGKIRFVSEGTYVSQPRLQKVVILVNDAYDEQEAGSDITEVWVRGEAWKFWSWDEKLGELVIERLEIEINELSLGTIGWK